MAGLAIGLYFYLLFCFIFIFLYALHIASDYRPVPTDALCTYTRSGLSNRQNRVSPTSSREILVSSDCVCVCVCVCVASAVAFAFALRLRLRLRFFSLASSIALAPPLALRRLLRLRSRRLARAPSACPYYYPRCLSARALALYLSHCHYLLLIHP